MTCNTQPILAALVAVLCGAVGGIPVGAAESDEYQRVASHKETPVEVTADATILAQPDSNPRVAVGGVELQLGLRLWDRWDLHATGRLPVDVVAREGETYRVHRSTDPAVVVGTGYSIGPPQRRHRVGTSLEPERSWSLSYVLATIRDPMVQGVGLTGEVRRNSEMGWDVNVRVPLSAALVVNDVTSLRAELSPAVTNVTRKPRGSLSAVISVSWAWERFNIGSAALFGEHGAPGGMALSGGWKWRRKD